MRLHFPANRPSSIAAFHLHSRGAAGADHSCHRVKAGRHCRPQISKTAREAWRTMQGFIELDSKAEQRTLRFTAEPSGVVVVGPIQQNSEEGGWPSDDPLGYRHSLESHPLHHGRNKL